MDINEELEDFYKQCSVKSQYKTQPAYINRSLSRSYVIMTYAEARPYQAFLAMLCDVSYFDEDYKNKDYLKHYKDDEFWLGVCIGDQDRSDDRLTGEYYTAEEAERECRYIIPLRLAKILDEWMKQLQWLNTGIK